MLVQCVPTTVFALETDGLCEHHTEHTAECGYVPAAAGMDCAHVHDEVCGYVEAVAEAPCSCETTDENGAIVHAEGCGYVAPVTGSDCTHTHDEVCGYAQEVKGSDCTFVCEECKAEEKTCTCESEDPGEHAPFCDLYERTYEACLCVLNCAEEGLNTYCETCYFEGVEACGASGEEEDVPFAETSGTTSECTWTFDDSTGILTISGSGRMGTGGFSNIASSIKSVIIEDGVTSIGNYAFSGCASLTSVSIPGSVETIGNYAFSNCSSLTTVNYWGTTEPTIGRNAFSKCALTVINVHKDYKGEDFAGQLISKVLGNSPTPDDTTTYTVTATATPTEGGTVTGADDYAAGETVTLTAAAKTGYKFVNWTENGTEVGTEATYSFTASADRNLVANFVKLASYTVAVTADPAEGGTVTGSGSYAENASVTVTATAARGYRFTGWEENGEVVSTNASYTFTATANHDLTAVFEAHEHNWTYAAEGDTITAKCEGSIGTCPDAEQTIKVVAPTGSMIYDGKARSASIDGSIDGVTGPFIVYKQNGAEINETPTNAGTYTASITIDEVTASVEYTIIPKDISVVESCVFSLSKDTFVYSGTAPELTVTGVDNSVGSTALVEGKDYTIGTVQPNAGNHKLTVTGEGNYTGDVELDYTITKQQIEIPTMSWTVPENAVYNDTVYTATLNGELPTGIVATLSGDKATNAGDYTAKAVFSLAEGYSADNYEIVNGEDLTADWEIAKAAVTITAENKVIYIGEDIPTFAYKVSGLADGDKLTKNPTLTTNADADRAGNYTITAAYADAGDNYTITYVSGTLTIMDKETEVETRIVLSELTEVSDGLKNTEFDTVEEITEELISQILATATGYNQENVEHFDVTLQFSLDGGETWIQSTKENFPTEGITVILPYPEGTNAKDYDFVVSHMFTVTSQRLGTTAGDVEMPKVEETANGIRVTLNGLSPVTVAAKYHDHTGGTATCTDKAICSICGNAYGELDATNHAGGTEIKNAKDATCGAEGYTGDTHCKGCGEIITKGTVIKATGKHTYGDWKVVKEVTKTAKGEKQRTCGLCGHVDAEDIPVLTNNPATGDESNITLRISAMVVSLGALAVLTAEYKRRRSAK